MSAWKFETGGMATCGKQAGAFYLVEMATQDVDTTDWESGLTEPDFTTGVVTLSPGPFAVAKTEWNASFDAGNIGAGSQTYECHNYPITGSTRMSDILDSIDRDTEDLHIRISRKETSGGTYAAKYHGIVRWDSLEISYGDFDDPDTWIIKFQVDDTIQQLSRRTVEEFYEDIFLHTSYDFKCADLYYDYIGTTPDANIILDKGKYAAPALYFRTVDDSEPELYADTDARFILLTDIFEAAADYMGLTQAVNDGAAWNTVHKWVFGFNTADPGDTESMTWGGIENLYVISAFFKSTTYRQGGSFFETKADTSPQKAAFSFSSCGTVLEMLKRICVSLGLVCSIRLDSSGNRYLSIVEIANIGYTGTYGTNGTILKNANLQPYARGVSGIQVNSPVGTLEIGNRGDVGNSSVNVDCIFVCANWSRTQARAVDAYIQSGAAHYNLWPEVMGALYISTDSPTGSRGTTPGDALELATMYSVCAIVPKADGTAAPSTAYIEGAIGVYQSAAPFALNAVMYPSHNYPYCAYSEVPAMALAHYLFTPKVTGDIGIYRKHGRTLQFRQNGILQAIIYPGATLTISINSVAKVWRVVRVVENYLDEITEIEAELYE